MAKGILECGFNYEIDESVFEDMEFLDALTEMAENGLKFSTVVKMLFGENQRAKLYDHLKSRGIRPTIDVVSDIVMEIMTSSAEGKN